MGLSKDEILNAEDSEVSSVSVPEWNGDVFVRTITGTERDRFEAAFMNRNGPVPMTNIRAKLLVMALCDEQGNRLFTDSDVVALGKKNARALDRAFATAMRVNGIGEEAIEGLGKGLENVPSDGSGTD